MDNYQQMAIDEVYDILLYNPDVDNEIKINFLMLFSRDMFTKFCVPIQLF